MPKRLYINPFRTLILFTFIVLPFLSSCQSDSGKDNIRFYIGSYAEESESGILSCQLDISNYSFEILSSTSGIKNPSFLTLDPNGEYLYAVSEVDDFAANSAGGVFAFRINPANASISLINSVQSGGAHPCHLAIHPDGKNIYVANYTGGNISSIRISSSGELLNDVQTIQHLTIEPSIINQQGQAHAHSVNPISNGRFLFACDLGMDKVFGYSINPQSKRLKLNDSGVHEMAPKSGPRHMAFSQDERFAFVINELSSTITICSNDPETGIIAALQSISTLPDDYKGESYCADIHVHPNNRFVYASNRGHNSIAVFKLDTDGALDIIQYQSTKGDWPRNFAIDPEGQVLLVANQRSDNVVIFRIDQETGMLVETGMEITVSKPACIIFLK